MPPFLRLLNTSTYELVDNDRTEKKSQVPYVVFSHTWLDPAISEVTYRDMKDHFQLLKSQQFDKEPKIKDKRPGWLKLKNLCDFCAQYGFSRVWMDTCCINKDSTKETETSIHGMYEFYADSVICFAYLADVHSSRKEKIKLSRWFTRGWTLQELIAPRSMAFISQDWKHLGYREEFLDVPELKDIFKRDPASINTYRQLTSAHGDTNPYNLATRLSWSGSRETTHVEDQSYALCGLYGIKLRVKYPEGSATFFRFQKALSAKYINDLTLLAWFSTNESAQRYTRDHGRCPPPLGILAPSICFFLKVPPMQWQGGIIAPGPLDKQVMSGSTPATPGLLINDNYVYVDTMMFEFPSSSQSSKQRTFVLKLTRSNSYGAGIVATKTTTTQGKEIWKRTCHDRGLFFFKWHHKDETCSGFFDDKWPATNGLNDSGKFQYTGMKHIGLRRATFQL